MAVTTWTAGQVLAAQDLNDTFASKPTFTYGTATPTADANGAIWYDENDTPPTPKFWDGSAWQPFSSGVGDAVISSPAATGSYTDSGIDYEYFSFTASGTLTVDDVGDGVGGLVDVLVVGGGGPGGAEQSGVAGGAGGGGGAGVIYKESYYLAAGSYTVTVGAGGAFNSTQYGNRSVLDKLAAGGGGQGGCNGNPGPRAGFLSWNGGGGSSLNSDSVAGGASIWGIGFAGGDGGSNEGGGGGGAGGAGSGTTPGVGVANSLTGSSVTYGAGGNQSNAGGGAGTANSGNGGAGSTSTTGNAGGSGIVIVRVKV